MAARHIGFYDFTRQVQYLHVIFVSSLSSLFFEAIFTLRVFAHLNEYMRQNKNSDTQYRIYISSFPYFAAAMGCRWKVSAGTIQFFEGQVLTFTVKKCIVT